MSSIHIPTMSIGKAVSELAELYTPLILGKLPYGSIPSPFLWGQPGIGKSDAVRELAEVLEERTGKKVIVTDIRLLLFSPIDLRGVPVADETRSFTDWLKPRILDLDPSKKVVNILFLDELSAAPQSVQAAAYQLTLNRAIGEHKLPENTLVMAAGNRTTDKSVAFKMPSALANRMMHFEIEVDFDSWKEWAIESGDVHPYVLGYLSYDRSKLCPEDKNLDETAFPTPRSWMFVSNILNTVGDVSDIDRYRMLIVGCIGMGTAIEFIAWAKLYKDLPKTEDIFEGVAAEFPKTADVLYAITAAMTTYAVKKEKQDGLSNEEIENACAFCLMIPADYAVSFFLSVINIESIRLKLMKSESFMIWGKQHRNALRQIGDMLL